MNFEKSKVNSTLSPILIREQQNLETEIILPDYYDSINKVLKCTVVPEIETFTSSSDRLSVAGKAVVSLLYMGEDKKLYNHVSEIKYTKVINSNGIEIKDNYYVEQNVVTLNYRAVGPKKIDVKCVVEVAASLYKLTEAEYISDIECDFIFDKKRTSEVFNFVGLYNRAFSVLHDVQIDRDKGIKFVLRNNCETEISETKIMANKMFIKGNCKVNMLYISENDSINNNYYDLPFSEVFDMYGISEEDVYDIFNISSSVATDNIVKTDVDSMHINVNVSLSVMVTKKQKIDFIEDIYSTKNELDVKYSELSFIRAKEKFNDNFSMALVADTFIEDSFTICDSFVDNVRIKCKNQNRNTIEVSAEFNALIKLSDGSYSLLSRSYSDEFNIKNEYDFQPEIINHKVLSVSALQYSENNIRFVADTIVFVCVSDYCKADMLTNVDVSDMIITENNGIILYYAESGEKMWDIAKENKCSVRVVKELNGISDDDIKERKMLIIANN